MTPDNENDFSPPDAGARKEWVRARKTAISEEGKYGYRREAKEWPGLLNRIGEPRIAKHEFFPELVQRIEAGAFGHKPAYFEIAPGHGNDLREIREWFDAHGFPEATTLGVDISEAEIQTGLEYYREFKGENTARAAAWFAQGELLELPRVKRWNSESGHYDLQDTLKTQSFDILYMEAVLHGLGRGSSHEVRLTDAEKYQQGSEVMKRAFNLAKPGAVFFGRINARQDESVTPRILTAGREKGREDWRYHPTTAECELLLQGTIEQPRFILANTQISVRDEADREGYVFWSFMAEKPNDQ